MSQLVRLRGKIYFTNCTLCSGDVEEDFEPGPPACHGVWPDRQNADPWAGEL